jgi:geranylgeranyl diphosphate synthase type II
VKVYENFSQKIGLAFQVKDDLLDVQGTQEETGKSVGGEDKGFVFFMGVEKTQEYLNMLVKECEEIIFPLKNERLIFLIEYVKERKK